MAACSQNNLRKHRWGERRGRKVPICGQFTPKPQCPRGYLPTTILSHSAPVLLGHAGAFSPEVT